MRYIDPHIHMISRTTDDYQRMAQAGCVAVTEPAFWAGFDRSSPQGFFYPSSRPFWASRRCFARHTTIFGSLRWPTA